MHPRCRWSSERSAHRARPAACLLLLVGLHAEGAPEPLRSEEQAVINFGFATQLGSGIYSISGRTLQVYRLPIGYTLPAEDVSRLSVRLTAPLTIGFLDFKARDVIDSGLPEHLDAFSFVPGIAFDVAVAPDWQLEPFAEAGIARDRGGDVDQRVYSIGLRSRYDLERGPADWQIYGEALRTVVRQSSTGETDDFSRLRLGATARRPFDSGGEGRRADFLVYGFAEAFTDAPAGPAGQPRDSNALQFEVGLTLGATQSLRIWRMPLPRIGLGYRFGDGVTVYRLVLGSPY